MVKACGITRGLSTGCFRVLGLRGKAVSFKTVLSRINGLQVLARVIGVLVGALGEVVTFKA